jgi:hypothetical protein
VLVIMVTICVLAAIATPMAKRYFGDATNGDAEISGSIQISSIYKQDAER